MNDKSLKIAGISILCLAIIFAIFRMGTASSRRERARAMANLEMDEIYLLTMGQAIAERAAPGPVLWVRYRPEDRNAQQRVNRMREALLEGLGAGAWQVIEQPDETMSDDAVGAWNLSTYGGAWGSQLASWANQSPAPHAIVISVPLPRLSPAQWRALPPLFGNISAWEASSELGRLVAQNGGRVAIQRDINERLPENGRARDPQELFARYYKWLEMR